MRCNGFVEGPDLPGGLRAVTVSRRLTGPAQDLYQIAARSARPAQPVKKAPSTGPVRSKRDWSR
ncbi:MAG TPA: hypothetical protein VFV73_18415 [Streptosporangiaceae bacterium]|nr:hypothetical protein [Streptosporangiaceae bacterium]